MDVPKSLIHYFTLTNCTVFVVLTALHIGVIPLTATLQQEAVAEECFSIIMAQTQPMARGLQMGCAATMQEAEASDTVRVEEAVA